jgi:hypothetical protein
LSTDLTRDIVEDDPNETSEDLVGSSRSRCMEGSTALDGATVAAAVGDRGGNRRGGEGGGDEEGDFGEHLECR